MCTKSTLTLFFSLMLLAGTSAQTYTTPPPLPVRAMAEWEEIQALVICWTQETTILTEIVRAARKECRVIICCNNQSTVNSATSKLTSSGVDISSNITFLIAPLNSIWVRDFGPNCVYVNEVDSLNIVDWIYNRDRPQDNTIPLKIAQHLNLPVYSTSVAPYDLVNTGGNFMTDGMGTAFASKLIFINNDQTMNGECGTPDDVFGTSNHTESEIDNILQEFMGIDRYVKFDLLPYDCIHHIDMHIKLLDEETLLVGQYPPGVADGPQIEANIQYVLSQVKSSFGTPYKVVRIPMPPENGLYPNNSGDYRTYANAVFVNKTVILPFYEQKYDTTALRIWQETLPGYEVVGINCNTIIPSKGAIHCITKEIGVADPLRIVHQELTCQDNSLTPDGYAVNAYIKHRSGINGARIYYTTDLSGPWETSEMHQGIISNGDWFGAIPSQPEGSTVYYYIEATAVSGKVMTRPITAPQGWWNFCINQGSATVEAAIDLKEIYPNPSAALTVIPVNAAAKTMGSILIYNSLGQLVQQIFEGEIPAGDSNYFLDAGQMRAGAYMVKLQTGAGVRLKKLVVR